MKLLSIQEGYKRLFDRQIRINELQLHAGGHCAHVGKISLGCMHCFYPGVNNINLILGPPLQLPSRCNCNCVYCPDPLSIKNPDRILDKDLSEEEIQRYYPRYGNYTLTGAEKHHLQNILSMESETIPTLAFSGGGDPLIHLDVITQIMAVTNPKPLKRSIHNERGSSNRGYFYLYTNGLLADLNAVLKLKDLGLDEIRFHLGATNFSKKVYKNMEIAVKHIDTVTIETPSWPPHRKKLLEMLPIIEDMGVKHVNIGQVVLTPYNIERIKRAMPDAEVYQVDTIVLDDGGLVYDLMEEVIKNKYSYSVLDCNGFVKQIQRPSGKEVICDRNLKGLCVDKERWLAKN